MPTLSWSALNILAWIFGLKAAYDLRAEFDPGTKAWVFLTWAVWSCLLMELAMVAAPHVAGLSLFSALTGIASGILLGTSFHALRRDAEADQAARLRSLGWDRAFAGGYLFSALGAVALAHALPAVDRWLVGLLNTVEETIWLVVSGALATATFVRPATRNDTAFQLPRALGVAFVFAFAGAAFTPLTRLTGWRADVAIGHLFSTLFILTLVTTLYAMVLHVRGAKLVTVALHSLVVVVPLLVAASLFWRRVTPLLAGMLSHGAVDLLTHRTSAYNHAFPIPMAPMESPLDYKDPAFTILEHLALLMFVGWLVWRWRRVRWS